MHNQINWYFVLHFSGLRVLTAVVLYVIYCVSSNKTVENFRLEVWKKCAIVDILNYGATARVLLIISFIQYWHSISFILLCLCHIPSYLLLAVGVLLHFTWGKAHYFYIHFLSKVKPYITQIIITQKLWRQLYSLKP